MENQLRDQIYQLCQKGYENAYAPYSKFRVGAALVTKDNKAFIGSNVENAAYGSSICAERSCLLSAYSNGIRKDDIIAFGVITKSVEPAMPCGACRQVMEELLYSDIPIYIFNTEGECIETDLLTLLPFAFNREDLNNV